MFILFKRPTLSKYLNVLLATCNSEKQAGTCNAETQECMCAVGLYPKEYCSLEEAAVAVCGDLNCGDKGQCIEGECVCSSECAGNQCKKCVTETCSECNDAKQNQVVSSLTLLLLGIIMSVWTN